MLIFEWIIALYAQNDLTYIIIAANFI